MTLVVLNVGEMLGFSDAPPVRLQSQIARAFQDAINFVVRPEERDNSSFRGEPLMKLKLPALYSSLIDRLKEINRIEACGVAPKDSDNSLAYLVAHFDLLVSTCRALDEALVSAFEELWPDQASELVAQELRVPRGLYAELVATVENLTAQHMDLQSHLEHFVIAGRSELPEYGELAMPDFNEKRKVVKERRDFYEPLVALRDEYFTEARGETLAAYLAKADELAATEFYRSLDCTYDYIRAESTNSASATERLALALEVGILLENV